MYKVWRVKTRTYESFKMFMCSIAMISFGACIAFTYEGDVIPALGAGALEVALAIVMAALNGIDLLRTAPRRTKSSSREGWKRDMRVNQFTGLLVCRHCDKTLSIHGRFACCPNGVTQFESHPAPQESTPAAPIETETAIHRDTE